jgi:hypothetical protein
MLLFKFSFIFSEFALKNLDLKIFNIIVAISCCFSKLWIHILKYFFFTYDNNINCLLKHYFIKYVMSFPFIATSFLPHAHVRLHHHHHYP